MDRYEYTVIAAPDRGNRAKSAKTPTDRYALALTELLNDMAGHGWEYQRAETLPSEERSGIASRQTLWHNVLIFRREIGGVAEVAPPAPAPAMAAESVATATPPAAATAPPAPSAAEATKDPAPARAEAGSEAATTAAPKQGPQRAANTPPLRRSGTITEQATTPNTPRLGPAAR